MKISAHISRATDDVQLLLNLEPDNIREAFQLGLVEQLLKRTGCWAHDDTCTIFQLCLPYTEPKQ